MFYNDYSSEKAASRKSIVKGNEVEGVQEYLLKTKRWERPTGKVIFEQETVTIAALEAQKAALQSKIVEINKMLSDIAKL